MASTPQQRLALWRAIVEAGKASDVCDDIVRSRPAPPALLARLIDPKFLPLTVRELDVLQTLANGEDVGAVLMIAPSTVKHHVENMKAKLAARSRAHAVAIGFRSNLIG